MRPLAVVAIGGNALTRPDQSGSHEEIAANSAAMAACLARLRAAGWGVAAVHGNGPQIGNLALQQDAAATSVPAQPLHQLCAMTQGQLGGVLVREVDRLCGPGTAVAVVTHVRVDRGDAAFQHPTKPIGPFLSAAQARAAARDRGWQVADDAGRGFRRVVPSPIPLDIVEMAAIRSLLEAGYLVLAAGGGGIAVSRTEDGRLLGVDAVVDKDHVAAALAASVGARDLHLLTGVDHVVLDHGTGRERPVHEMTPGQAQRYLAAGEFAAGSMGPKVAAALSFLRQGGQRAIITSPALLAATAAGEPGLGTRIESVRTSVVSAS